MTIVLNHTIVPEREKVRPSGSSPTSSSTFDSERHSRPTQSLKRLVAFPFL